MKINQIKQERQSYGKKDSKVYEKELEIKDVVFLGNNPKGEL